ncbi:DUF1146 family protein [Paenibacillus gallinarum]|nr:DUF1146 family protein [Paenibacillus gallinarum]
MDQLMNDQVNQAISTNSLVAMIISLSCIAIAWWSLQHLKLDLIVKHPKSAPARMLQLLLAIVLGHFVSKFVIEYLSWAQMLKYLF